MSKLQSNDKHSKAISNMHDSTELSMLSKTNTSMIVSTAANSEYCNQMSSMEYSDLTYGEQRSHVYDEDSLAKKRSLKHKNKRHAR
jgi:hypothetical protein